jgi:hypothetical protein
MSDKKKQNRFSKQAGLFDSPVVNPGAASNSIEKKPAKKWDEVMTKRFIAIQEIRKEIKYFSSDFENWARDNFGLESEEYSEAVKLAKKLSKTEALLYNITNMMTELSKTGALGPNTLKAFDQTFIKLASEAGWEIGAGMTIKANCLPGCTCGGDAECPDDPKCDACRSCQRARLEKKDASETDHPQEVAHKEASSCPTCGSYMEAEAMEGDQETMDMAMGEHVECNCKPEDNCPESRNCRYCPKCQDEIVAAAEPNVDYDMDYTIVHDDTDVSWTVTINGKGFASLEDAEQNLLDVLGDAINKMDLETEDGLDANDSMSEENLEDLDEGSNHFKSHEEKDSDGDKDDKESSDNPFEKKDDKEEKPANRFKKEDDDADNDEDDKEEENDDDEDDEETKEASSTSHPQENAFRPTQDGTMEYGEIKQAQRTLDEGSPRGTWIEVKLSSADKAKALEAAFEERGIFAQPVSKDKDYFLRIHNSAKNIDQVISEVLKAHNVKATW